MTIKVDITNLLDHQNDMRYYANIAEMEMWYSHKG